MWANFARKEGGEEGVLVWALVLAQGRDEWWRSRNVGYRLVGLAEERHGFLHGFDGEADRSSSPSCNSAAPHFPFLGP